MDRSPTSWGRRGVGGARSGGSNSRSSQRERP
ncbi:hypothetical protein J1605_016453 [Eschrichtius robustus]|uniref:Uncharacterized protein n=1 Tax=Eschrichtius robustus TaxID=9764 RepID=A0AB34I6N7_ESCRO|nr:hypothetical protein J1605_016453 [Eschrichtius robustus]